MPSHLLVKASVVLTLGGTLLMTPQASSAKAIGPVDCADICVGECPADPSQLCQYWGCAFGAGGACVDDPANGYCPGMAEVECDWAT